MTSDSTDTDPQRRLQAKEAARRLRKDADRKAEEDKEIGMGHGLMWAFKSATFAELKKIAESAESADEGRWITFEVDGDDDGTLFEELLSHGAVPNGNRIVWPRDPYIEGFLEGAATGYYEALDAEDSLDDDPEGQNE